MSNQTNPPQLEAWMQRADEFARREPAKAVAFGFGAGFLLNLLPLGAIAALLIEIALCLVRPALLIMGLLKAGEFCCSKNSTPQHHE